MNCPTEKSLNSTVCEKAEHCDRSKPKKPITRKVVNINFVTLIVTIFSIMAIPNLTFPYRKKKKKIVFTFAPYHSNSVYFVWKCFQQ